MLNLNCNESRHVSSDWQCDYEGRAATAVLYEFEASAVGRYDAVADRQAESGSFSRGLGCEEWIEDLLRAFRIDTFTRIRDLDGNLVVDPPRRYIQISAIRHRIACIEKDV